MQLIAHALARPLDGNQATQIYRSGDEHEVSRCVVDRLFKIDDLVSAISHCRQHRSGARILGNTVYLLGEPYSVVGVLQPRRGGFFGENRQDSVMAIPAGTANRRFPDADATVLYLRAEGGQLQRARSEIEAALRRDIGQLSWMTPDAS